MAISQGLLVAITSRPACPFTSQELEAILSKASPTNASFLAMTLNTAADSKHLNPQDLKQLRTAIRAVYAGSRAAERERAFLEFFTDGLEVTERKVPFSARQHNGRLFGDFNFPQSLLPRTTVAGRISGTNLAYIREDSKPSKPAACKAKPSQLAKELVVPEPMPKELGTDLTVDHQTSWFNLPGNPLGHAEPMGKLMAKLFFENDPGCGAQMAKEIAIGLREGTMDTFTAGLCAQAIESELPELKDKERRTWLIYQFQQRACRLAMEAAP